MLMECLNVLPNAGIRGWHAPAAHVLLAEIMPTRHRGWSLVMVGGIGALGGYLAASVSRSCFSRNSVGASCGSSIYRPD